MELEHNVQGQLLQEEIHFCTIYGDPQWTTALGSFRSGGGQDLNESSESLPSHVELIWREMIYLLENTSILRAMIVTSDGLKTWLQILSHLLQEGM